MYRKTIASIEQSAHEQLPERDCRCMRGTEKSVHTPCPTFLCHYCKLRIYPTNNQLITIFYFEKGNGLATCYLLQDS